MIASPLSMEIKTPYGVNEMSDNVLRNASTGMPCVRIRHSQRPQQQPVIFGTCNQVFDDVKCQSTWLQMAIAPTALGRRVSTPLS